MRDGPVDHAMSVGRACEASGQMSSDPTIVEPTVELVQVPPGGVGL